MAACLGSCHAEGVRQVCGMQVAVQTGELGLLACPWEGVASCGDGLLRQWGALLTISNKCCSLKKNFLNLAPVSFARST